jgi:tRNA threonylcarbamoyl adenosine modification protein YeaZ
VNKRLVLGIEAAVLGGSISVAEEGDVLASWANPSGPRSDQLLIGLDELFSSSGVDMRSIAAIAASVGPGSYTGIRIGLSTAMGLAYALGVPCRGVSLLNAIGSFYASIGNRIVVLPIGREGYCWKHFGGTDETSEPPEAGKLEQLTGAFEKIPVRPMVITHESVVSTLTAREQFNERTKIVKADNALAAFVAAAPAQLYQDPSPFYAAESLPAKRTYL